MKIIKKIMLSLLLAILVLSVSVFAFIQQAKFGKTPSGARLERIKKSPHYKDGSFQNLHLTPSLTEGASYYGVMKEFLFSKKIRIVPTDTLPSVKTDLLHLDPAADVL